MDVTTPAVRHLAALSGPDRADELERMIVQEFKDALLMPEDEELPLDESYFELGLTSLRMVDTKERLEELLGLEIGASVLFDNPTVGGLVDHLSTVVLGAVDGVRS
jgi:acyl carrier protein